MQKNIITVGDAVKDTLNQTHPNGYTLALVHGKILAEMTKNNCEISFSTLQRYMTHPLSDLPQMQVGFLCAVSTVTGCSLYEYANKYAGVSFNDMAIVILKVD